MDYEKKYKEALALARSYYDKDSMNAFLDTIFPELRESESEDERIRKWLVDYFTEIGENWIHREFTCKQIVAYLEKQKEPTKEELYAEAGTTEKEYIANTMKMVRAMREKQKEQKPAEVDESIKRLNDNWMKKYFDDYQEKKPAEWSEEDEKMLNDCIMALSNWRDAVANYGHEVAPCQKLIDWLKALRPSWKPSEEQIYSLGTVVNGMGESAFGVSKNLCDLYEQLKKL